MLPLRWEDPLPMHTCHCKQGRQSMCNVTLRRVRKTNVAVQKHYYAFPRARVRVRACRGPGAWACACARARVALFNQQATCMRHIVLSLVASLAPPYFSTLSHERRRFREKIIEYTRKMCFDFLYNFYLKYFSLYEELSEIL